MKESDRSLSATLNHMYLFVVVAKTFKSVKRIKLLTDPCIGRAILQWIILSERFSLSRIRNQFYNFRNSYLIPKVGLI
jgi:hypothetical protein